MSRVPNRLRVVIVSLASIMVLVVAAPPAAAQELELTAAEAADHIGEEATVCGRVAQAVFVESQGSQPTYLNIGGPWPEQLFNVMIRGRHRPRFSEPPEQMYADREICVTGLIEEAEGRPQIAVTRPEQITIVTAEETSG